MAKSKAEIKVTEKHIKKGLPNDPSSCPIAHAILDYFGPARVESIDVTGDGIELTLTNGWYLCYDTPPKLVPFITDFDKGKVVKPLKFDLPMPK